MLTKRIPQNLLEKAPSLQNCNALLRAVWQRKHKDVYKILRELPWPDQLEPLIRRYDSKRVLPSSLRRLSPICLGHFQEKTLVEISKAYEAIKPASASAYLGIDLAASEQCGPAAIERFIAYGWTRNEQENLLRPSSATAEPGKNVDISNRLNEAVALVGNSGR